MMEIAHVFSPINAWEATDSIATSNTVTPGHMSDLNAELVLLRAYEDLVLYSFIPKGRTGPTKMGAWMGYGRGSPSVVGSGSARLSVPSTSSPIPHSPVSSKP